MEGAIESVCIKSIRKAWFDCILQTAGVIPQVVFLLLLLCFQAIFQPFRLRKASEIFQSSLPAVPFSLDYQYNRPISIHYKLKFILGTVPDAWGKKTIEIYYSSMNLKVITFVLFRLWTIGVNCVLISAEVLQIWSTSAGCKELIITEDYTFQKQRNN